MTFNKPLSTVLIAARMCGSGRAAQAIVATWGLLICALLASTAHAQNTLRVTNNTKDVLHITISEERVRVVESSDRAFQDKSRSFSFDASKKEAITVQGVELSDEKSIGGAFSSNNISEKDVQKKFEWTPFVKAGEKQYKPRETATIPLAGTAYFYSVRVGDKILVMNVQQDLRTRTTLVFGSSKVTANRKVTLTTLSNSRMRMADSKGALRNVLLHATSGGKAYHVRNKEEKNKFVKYGEQSIIFLFAAETRGIFNKTVAVTDGAHWNAYLEPLKYNSSQLWVFERIPGQNDKDDFMRDGDRVSISLAAKPGVALTAKSDGVIGLTDKDSEKTVWTVSVSE